MKITYIGHLTIKLFVLSFCTGSLIHAQPIGKESALISVVSDVSGSLVIIDDDSVGTTPIFAYTVLPGTHRVTVQRLNKQSWFASDWTGTFQIPAGDSLVINPQFHEIYHIQSKPYGARIYNEEQLLGETPVVLEFPASKEHRLVLEKDGYFSKVIECLPMGEHLIKVMLEADDNYWLEQDILQKKLKSKLNRRKKLTYLSTALSFASGVGAVWFKRQADNYYKDYQNEIDPQKMNDYFSKAEKYDRLSTASFGAFQVSFGFSLYYFIKSHSKN